MKHTGMIIMTILSILLLSTLDSCPESCQINHMPTVAIQGGDVTVDNNVSHTFTATAQDEDGDVLTYQWSVSGSDIGGATSNQFSLSRNPATQTTYQVKVTVNDGKYTASDQVNCTVRAPAASNPVVNITVFDNSAAALNGATVRVLETAAQQTLTGNSITLNLASGTYTILVEKAGYITQGYCLQVAGDKTINAYLKPLPAGLSYGSISGEVRQNGAAYSGAFVLSKGHAGYSDEAQFSAAAGGIFSGVSCVGGTDFASAYTLSAAADVEKVVYKRGLSVAANQALTGVVLDFTAGALNYSGSKPAGALLWARTGLNHLLAQGNATTTAYSMAVNLSAGDRLRLEVIGSGSESWQFARVDAGAAGGTANLAFGAGIPTMAVTETADSFQLTVGAVSGAVCYEVFVAEWSGGASAEVYRCLSVDQLHINVPKNGISAAADKVWAYALAKQVGGFTEAALLAGTQDFSAYTEGVNTYVLRGTRSAATPDQVKAFYAMRNE